MRILSFKSRGNNEDGFQFPTLKFGKINLVVGNSGAGKTRLINSIFNAAYQVTHKEKFFSGAWDLTLEHNSIKYQWIFERAKDEGEGPGRVVRESICRFDEGQEVVLVDRTPDYFKFDGDDLPKLSLQESSISMLKDEDLIKPIYEALSSIMRRNFSGADLDNEAIYQVLPVNFLEKIEKTKNLSDLFRSGLKLSCKLYILSKFFKDVYDEVCAEFIATFPFVSKVKLLDADEFSLGYPGIVPVFALKEKHVNNWIPLIKFSSGMKKVLLILSDIFILPKEGCVYIVDEYENSLGVNAINFFPSVLLAAGSKNQYIITSHHPYIIGNVAVKDWIVIHRKGNIVHVKQGEELVEKFGKSKQQAFIQLLNDPFYAEGVE
jgi:Fe-S cluster assembly ATPase SufC